MKAIRTIGDAPDDWEQQHEQALQKVRQHLGGLHPAITGSVLAYLTALWVMGHQTNDEGHRMLLDRQADAIREMLPIAGKEIEIIKRGAPQ